MEIQSSYIVGNRLPGRDDCSDARQRPSHGVHPPFRQPGCRLCRRLDILVSFTEFTVFSWTGSLADCATTRFAYAVLAGEQLVAVSNAIKFRYDDGHTFLNWEIGERVDNAVWISVFLILVVIFNMFPVRVCIPTGLCA